LSGSGFSETDDEDRSETILSGHSHRAELMLNLVRLDYEFRAVDLAAGAQRQPEFLRRNPFDATGITLACRKDASSSLAN
jgi:hypothetical protein